MSETGYQLHIDAGPHDRFDCPITFRVPDRIVSSVTALTGPSGLELPIQKIAEADFAAVLPLLRAQTRTSFRFSDAAPDRHANTQEMVSLRVADARGEKPYVDIAMNGQLVTRYIYGGVKARPYFFPLCGPNGTFVTRSFPMDPNVNGETRDHPHHRSLWIAHGEVNGTDNWSEEPGHAYTRHHEINELISGPVFGRLATNSTWEDNQGATLLTQRLQMTLWATGDAVRLIDFDIDLIADYGDVLFGDTKEGGILSVRVASSMDVPRGGRITNSYGGSDEGETWGRSAHWCDYSGLAGGQHSGIAVLDHPLSFRHPTTWHVRNYGLMTANPFGYSAFTGGAKNGDYTLKRGETLSFHYRMVLHMGDAVQGNVSGHFLNYACPPAVSLTENE